MSASIWNPGGSIIPQADPNSQIKSEPFTATEGQTTFALTQFTYTLGVGALSIFRNGVKLVGASDVTEVSNTTFSVSPCDAGDSIEAVGNTAIADPAGMLAQMIEIRDATVVIAAEVDADKIAAQLAADEAAASAASLDLPIPVGSGGTGSTDAAGARTALAISALTTPNTPAGNIAATNVQAAINELDSEKAPKASPIFTGPVTIPQYYNVTQPYGALQVAGVDVMRFGGDTSGQLAGFRNILINGEVTRINRRSVANWATVPNGAYGYDRWKKVDASNITQIVEAGNFIPSNTYTLSGVGVTTQQITSPASGHWTIPNIPIAATYVQLELGAIATPFENRPIGLEEMLCQRYLPTFSADVAGRTLGSGVIYGATTGLAFLPFVVTPRVLPTSAVISTGDALRFIAGGVSHLSSSVVLNSVGLTGITLSATISGGTVGQGAVVAAGNTVTILCDGCEL